MIEFLLTLLLVSQAIAQEISIKTSISRTAEIPMLMQQLDGSIVRTQHAYTEWISYENNTVTDSTKKVKLGTIPDSCVVTSVRLFVTESFDAGGTDLLYVGYGGDHDAFITDAVVDLGNHTEIEGALVNEFMPDAHTVYAYYIGEGAAPTQGKCYVIVFWTQIKRKPL